VSSELQLIALAALLWLSDSALLLYADEVVFSCRGRSGWRVSTGLRRFLIRGRQLCLLNPFAFYRPSVRLRWNIHAAEEDTQADTAWSSELHRFSVAAPCSVTAFVGLFVLLPLGLFTPLGARAILPAVVLVYGCIAAALLVIRLRCRMPAFSKLQFAGFAFECLACPPFGISTVRRAALRTQVSEPLTHAAVRLLSPGQRRLLGSHCLGVLDEELQGLDDSAPVRQAIMRRRSYFESWVQTT
jgi:hypothetical protein